MTWELGLLKGGRFGMLRARAWKVTNGNPFGSSLVELDNGF